MTTTTRQDALTTTERILRARREALDWHPATWGAVQQTRPEALTTTDDEAWAVCVAAFRNEMEAPADAAKRLGLYLVLHREQYGMAPRLESVTRHHA